MTYFLQVEFKIIDWDKETEEWLGKVCKGIDLRLMCAAITLLSSSPDSTSQFTGTSYRTIKVKAVTFILENRRSSYWFSSDEAQTQNTDAAYDTAVTSKLHYLSN